MKKQGISVVQIGASKSEGGSRGSVVRVGGATSMPYSSREPNGLKPVVVHDVFDCEIPLPGTVKECYPGVLADPVDWARMQVKEYGAELVTLHMVSTDPRGLNRPVDEACKILEDVLQAVKVPLIVSGSGNPERDALLLSKAAETASGERCLLSTVGLEMDYESVAKAALEHGHSVLSLATLNPEEMRRLNRNLMSLGLGPERIVMDPFTGGIGYGVEYSVSAIQRMRLMGLDGVKELALPITSAVSNAWSAREAWMRKDEWGPREKRGPLWEASTALTTLLSGADLFMMLHPQAIKQMKDLINSLYLNQAGN